MDRGDVVHSLSNGGPAKSKYAHRYHSPRFRITILSGVWSTYRKHFFVFCWGVPLLAAVVPFMVLPHPYIPAHDDIIGVPAQWCWINRPNVGIQFPRTSTHPLSLQDESWDGQWFWLGMGTYFIPLWAVIGYNVVVTVSVLYHAHKMTRSYNAEEWRLVEPLQRLTRRLAWYPVILIVCQLPVTVARIYPLINLGDGDADDGPHDWFYCEVIATRGFFLVCLIYLCNTSS